MCPVCSRECCDLPPALPATLPRLRQLPQACTTKHMNQSSHPEQTSRHTRLLLYETQSHSLYLRSRGLPVVEEDCEPQSCAAEEPCSRAARPSVLDETSTVQTMCPAEDRLRSDLPLEAPCPSSVVRRSLWGRESLPNTHSTSGTLCVAPSGRYLLMSLVLCLLLAGGASGSEFPDRECCDSVPPPPPNYHHATSTTTTTTPPSPRVAQNSSSINGGSHASSGVMSCIEARGQCSNEPMCSSVLKMLHKICGPELMACATVTPSKCKQLLRTLSTFEYLSSCSCAEPNVDFTCYTFRETIFNHPCLRVDTDEVGHSTMPNCKDAYKTCFNMHTCTRDYLEFLRACSSDGITCLSKTTEQCNNVWKRIRLSPVFGCVCHPPSQMRVMAYRKDGTFSRNYSPKGIDSLPSFNSGQSCLEIYNSTHDNPCIVGQDSQRVDQVHKTQATCHVALEYCQTDRECRPYLDLVMIWCDHSNCEPDRCRSALQEFYERVSIVRRLQVAFCVCRQNDPDGECLTAMRKLHPTCAERHAGRGSAKCHVVAEQCRTNPACRGKLEEYEQKCAADAMTGRCSDTHRNCQQAVMNILGTELHATCVCKGTDFIHQHDCYTWQKLLWSNPCVIESHIKLHQEISTGSTEELDKIFQRPPTVRTTIPPRLPHLPPEEEDRRVRPVDNIYGTVIYGPDEDINAPPSQIYREFIEGGDINREHFPTRPETTKWRKPGLSVEGNSGRNGARHPIGRGWNRGTGGGAFGGTQDPSGGSFTRTDQGRLNINRHRGTPIPREDTRYHKERPINPSWPGYYAEPEPEQITRRPPSPPDRQPPPFVHHVVTTTPPAQPMPTSITTTTTPGTTTLPQRTCTIKNMEYERMTTLQIPEGGSRRLYKDKECSDLCHCRRADTRHGDPKATCTTLTCIDTKSCNTTHATFLHTMPHYLAYRGNCVCYAGKFICQKPDPGEESYSLQPGIYLFLGYSQGEMEILKPHTESTELEALEQMKDVLVRDYGFKCNLTTKHHIGENFIVVAKLMVSPDIYMSPYVKQRREKECAGPLQKLADKINMRHVDILTDAYLSMFILADVDVSIPEAHTASSSAGEFLRVSPGATLFMTLLTMLTAHVLTLGHLVVMVAPARPLRTT
ncbi:uncharacterized protein LOC122250711 isoform X2 [Penaeus japonicus]|uniref:uncharacterized protein LOC122250711 isoform X2 n=1 Tax=Penaeus japonicus TaxID=27405 RepID=UPI001C70D8BA|nr:uncharacterized protein LOC122250711 isoform X2 [Penaeus japonicus]